MLKFNQISFSSVHGEAGTYYDLYAKLVTSTPVPEKWYKTLRNISVTQFSLMIC